MELYIVKLSVVIQQPATCYGGYLNASLGKIHEYYRFVGFFLYFE